MDDNAAKVFEFGGLTLDLERGRLMKGAADVSLRPKSFALLSHLARNLGRVVSKNELMAELWPDVIVTEDSLTQCVHDVRRALGAHGQGFLRTVAGRGYLLTGAASGEPSQPVGIRPAAMPQVAVESGPDPAGRGAPLRHDGVAVLPFVLSAPGDPADILLLEGLAHDVISRLARLRSFHVIARGSVFAVGELASDPVAAGRALGVAYVVSGAAEMRDSEFRIRFDITAAESGALLWTEDFRGQRGSFVEVVGRITERIVQKVNLEVTASETRRALSIAANPLDAWQCYHAGLHHSMRFELARMPRALEMLERATQLDPGFARAHAAQSFCHFLHAFIDHGKDRPAKLTSALAAAEEAMRVDESNPSSHWAYGRALWLGGDPEGGLNHLRAAIDISPGYALAHYFSGLIETVHGDPHAAIAELDTSRLLSPFDPFAPSMEIMHAMALVRTGDLEQAAIHAAKAAKYVNAHEQILAPASMILCEAGHLEIARKIVGRVQAISPGYQASQLRKTFYGMPEQLDGLFRRNAATLGI
jgi:DNA-binding winged helix-turn-helix (wHTH) protein/TolB-like protein